MYEKAGNKNYMIAKEICSKKNFLIYLIGTSGSGKTTIANALAHKLENYGMKNFQVIDGDIIRQQFGGIFGYTREERMKCNRAVCVVVEYLLENNISVILSQVAAYEEMRQNVRRQFQNEYMEIFVKCSYEECARRDVKGYYKLQSEGKLHNLNGLNSDFEVPNHSDLIIDTEKENVEEALKKILMYLKEKKYVSISP